MSSSSETLSFLKNEGVALIEFSAVVVVLLIFIVGIVDFARVCASKALLQSGLERAIRHASTIRHLDIDTSSRYPNDLNYIRFLKARDIIEEDALGVAGLLLNSTDGGGPAFLNSFIHFYSSKDLKGVQRSIILIRPLEKVSTPDGKEWIQYPENFGPITPAPMPVMLRSFPIILKARASIVPLLPFISTYSIECTAIGYREKVQLSTIPASPPLPDEIISSQSTTSSFSSSSSSSTNYSTSSSSSYQSFSSSTSHSHCSNADDARCFNLPGPACYRPNSYDCSECVEVPCGN